jgi:hypothetical protein
MDQLEQAMKQRIGAVKSRSPALKARRRLSEVGRAYVYFALAEPGLFEVAFATQQAHDPTARPEDSGPYRVLGEALDELVDAGVLTKARREGADVVCWAAVHGFAMLHLRGPLREMPPEMREVTLGLLLAAIARGLISA